MIQQVNNDDQTFVIILIMTLNLFLIKTPPIYYSVHRTTTINVFLSSSKNTAKFKIKIVGCN